MKITDFKAINRMLTGLDAKNQPGEIYVDNLHCPYIKFEDKIKLPQSAITQPEISSIKHYIDILIDLLPEAIGGTCLLPEARPKRESGKLFFVRPINFANKQYLYVFSTDMLYLGGAIPDEVLKQASQNVSPSVLTDRIYFQAKIIPLESLTSEGNDIIDFTAMRFRGGVFRMDSERESQDTPINRFSEIFDEIDFSDLETNIRSELGINNEIWPMGRVYSPVGIDYLALSLRFLKPSLPKIIKEFRKFYTILDPGEGGISPETRSALHQYLFKHETSRTLSRSGNMLWKIHFTEFDQSSE